MIISLSSPKNTKTQLLPDSDKTCVFLFLSLHSPHKKHAVFQRGISNGLGRTKHRARKYAHSACLTHRKISLESKKDASPNWAIRPEPPISQILWFALIRFIYFSVYSRLQAETTGSNYRKRGTRNKAYAKAHPYTERVSLLYEISCSRSFQNLPTSTHLPFLNFLYAGYYSEENAVCQAQKKETF